MRAIYSFDIEKQAIEIHEQKNPSKPTVNLPMEPMPSSTALTNKLMRKMWKGTAREIAANEFQLTK
jgi:hypothetical protein